MASSTKVVRANRDVPRESSSMEDLLKFIHSEPDPCTKTDIVEGSDPVRDDDDEITLEDFLTKAGTAAEGGVGRIKRGKRGRGTDQEQDIIMDKATLQKQRRMIKNRESAARSRERKQAYTEELESLISKLEDDKARLLDQRAHQNKQRLNQLMEYVIPVEEKRSPTRRNTHRRVNSVQW